MILYFFIQSSPIIFANREMLQDPWPVAGYRKGRTAPLRRNCFTH